jgi:hypothetical protein
MTVECTVADRGGGLIATVTGRLGDDDVGALRLRLMKCLAEQPRSLIIDLNGMRTDQPLSLAVFLVITRQAAYWPGIPVLLCTGAAETRAQLQGAAYRRLLVFRDVESARRHTIESELPMPTLSDEILPVTGAGRHARNVVTDACLSWDLPDLVGPASLIANEFIANVVVHAGTMATLRLSLLPRHLAIAVRDGSDDAPVLRPDGDEPGRGLMLVEAMAASWGWLPLDGGKVVWATLLR